VAFAWTHKQKLKKAVGDYLLADGRLEGEMSIQTQIESNKERSKFKYTGK
jgi:hypothetical protein